MSTAEPPAGDLPPITIRAAVPADATGIARAHTDAWRETYAALVPTHFFDEASFARRRSWWERYLALDPQPGRLAVAERSTRIVGFANAGAARGPDAEKGFTPARATQLFAIYLLAEAHGSGTGKALLDAVLDGGPAQLWVARDNARAISFYRREGFRPDGVEYADPGIDGLVELRMVR